MNHPKLSITKYSSLIIYNQTQSVFELMSIQSHTWFERILSKNIILIKTKMTSYKIFICLILWCCFMGLSFSHSISNTQNSSGIKTTGNNLVLRLVTTTESTKSSTDVLDARIITSPMRCRPGERLDRRRNICRRILYVWEEEKNKVDSILRLVNSIKK